ncbi:MAG: ATP phosphoribosyltransferase [Pseudomonadota bacterium]
MNDSLIFAVPKGRILAEALPLMARAGIEPEPAFHDPKVRALKFATNVDGLSIIRVRAFDAATFVAHGAADFGIVGNDVIMEFGYEALYAPVDLGIGGCRLSLAEPAEMAAADDPKSWSHVRVATKYPNVTSRHFAARGVQAECVKLNGAMELAPSLGLAHRIVDLVSSGQTLKDNGLVEVETIADVTSRLIVSRPAFKRKAEALTGWLARFRDAAAPVDA